MNPGFTGFATIASFRVEISGGGIEFEEEFDGDESVSEYKLTSLIPLTHYTVSLYVVNDAGFESEPAVVQESTLSLSKHALSHYYPYLLTHTVLLSRAASCGRPSDSCHKLHCYPSPVAGVA